MSPAIVLASAWMEKVAEWTGASWRGSVPLSATGNWRPAWGQSGFDDGKSGRTTGQPSSTSANCAGASGASDLCCPGCWLPPVWICSCIRLRSVVEFAVRHRTINRQWSRCEQYARGCGSSDAVLLAFQAGLSTQGPDDLPAPAAEGRSCDPAHWCQAVSVRGACLGGVHGNRARRVGEQPAARAIRANHLDVEAGSFTP